MSMKKISDLNLQQDEVIEKIELLETRLEMVKNKIIAKK